MEGGQLPRSALAGFMEKFKVAGLRSSTGLQL